MPLLTTSALAAGAAAGSPSTPPEAVAAADLSWPNSNPAKNARHCSSTDRASFWYWLYCWSM